MDGRSPLPAKPNFYRSHGEDVLIAVRLTPRAERDEVSGIINVNGRPALSIRLAAAPVEGAANKALIAFLAKRLGVPKSAVSIETGEKARLKIVRVPGAAEAALNALV